MGLFVEGVRAGEAGQEDCCWLAAVHTELLLMEVGEDADLFSSWAGQKSRSGSWRQNLVGFGVSRAAETTLKLSETETRNAQIPKFLIGLAHHQVDS